MLALLLKFRSCKEAPLKLQGGFQFTTGCLERKNVETPHYLRAQLLERKPEFLQMDQKSKLHRLTTLHLSSAGVDHFPQSMVVGGKSVRVLLA